MYCTFYSYLQKIPGVDFAIGGEGVCSGDTGGPFFTREYVKLGAHKLKQAYLVSFNIRRVKIFPLKMYISQIGIVSENLHDRMCVQANQPSMNYLIFLCKNI